LAGVFLATTLSAKTATDVPFLVTTVIVFILCVCVHEFGHAIVADKLGDPTPERQGRLTLNPIAHMDIIGTLIVPIFGGLSGIPFLAWGKPVETVPHLMTRRLSMTQSMAIVAFAGPAANLAFAVVVGILMVLLTVVWPTWSAAGALHSIFASLLFANVSLMVFNLLPIHPLDGGKIVAAFLPKSIAHLDVQLRAWGPYLLIALLVIGRGFYGPLIQSAHEIAFGLVARLALALGN
jgi:Zn-dependent protease